MKRRAFFAFFYKFKRALSNQREIGHPFLPVVMRLARVSRIFNFETVKDVATLDRCQCFIPPGHEETLHFFDGGLSLPVIRIFEQLLSCFSIIISCYNDDGICKVFIWCGWKLTCRTVSYSRYSFLSNPGNITAPDFDRSGAVVFL